MNTEIAEKLSCFAEGLSEFQERLCFYEDSYECAACWTPLLSAEEKPICIRELLGLYAIVCHPERTKPQNRLETFLITKMVQVRKLEYEGKALVTPRPAASLNARGV